MNANVRLELGRAELAAERSRRGARDSERTRCGRVHRLPYFTALVHGRVVAKI